MMGDGRFFTLLVLGIVAAIVVVGGGMRQVGHHVDAQQCRAFGVASSREVRFVDYTFWSWDCLTPSGEGQWISVDALREVD